MRTSLPVREKRKLPYGLYSVVRGIYCNDELNYPHWADSAKVSAINRPKASRQYNAAGRMQEEADTGKRPDGTFISGGAERGSSEGESANWN